MSSEGPWSAPPEPKPPRRRSSRPNPIALLTVVAVIVGGIWLWLGSQAAASPVEGERVLWFVPLLAVIGAGLVARRLKLKQTLQYGLIWAAVVAVLLVGYSFRDELGVAAGRVQSELSPSDPTLTAPHEMAVIRGEDDNFYVTGRVNGVPVRFLVDTGASDIVLAPGDAKRLGLDVAALHYGGVYETANGIGHGAPFRADSLAIGDIQLADVRMSINQAAMRTSLLGMSFFKRLESFEVRGSRLYMRWRPEELSPAGR